ncbi:MAG: thiamine pyrophosphate-binding protein [Rhodospirillales bacterium]|nr:thiamine pyrophosphate-binding protein [Rhodospirillales bacterium]
MTTTSDIIGKRLYDAGCRHAFGIPGGEVLSLMEGLENAGIDFHLVKHENAGGFMAEGTYHATGAPGILVATVGPGVVNAINVVANAWQDQVPMIFLTGCVDAAEAETYTHQVFDHTDVIRPISKASMIVADGVVDVMIDKALAIAMQDPPGPVHLDVPINIAGKDAKVTGYPGRAATSKVAPAAGPDLERARNAIANAERPLMIGGVDILHHDAAAVIDEAVHRLNMPILTSYKAKGVVAENDPLSLGGHGLSPKSFKALKPMIDDADVIVLAGYDPIEMRIDWRHAWSTGLEGKTVIEVAGHPNTHYVHQADISFVCDVGEGVKALTHGLNGKETWKDGAIEKMRAQLRDAFPRDESWGPAAVIDAARTAFPKDGFAAVDTGAHRILLSQQWDCYLPRTLAQSTGLCTMGCAVPIALGHKIANPDTPVIAFTGDGGMEMILGELATLRDMKLPVVIVVFVDESLALIELKQRANKQDNLGVDFGGTDFAKLADVMGGIGVTATDRETLEKAISDGLDAETFTLVACPIGRKAYDGRF